MTTVAVLLVAVALLGLVIATLSTRLRDLPLSEPLLALVAGVLLGPAVTGAIDLPPVTQRSHEMHELSQVLLAVSVTTLEASTGSVGHSAQRRRADECR